MRLRDCLLATAILLPLSAQAAEINFSVMQSGTYDKAAAAIAQDFRAKTGATVNISAFPWAVLRQNNTTDLISGTDQYQVMSGGYYLADVYSYFQPLDDFIKKDDYAKGMIPGLMQPGHSEWFNDHQIGIPYGIDAFGLIINHELLKKAGVGEEFKDWQAVISACGTIEAKLPGVACFSHPTGNPEQIFAFFFSAYDGPFIDKDGHYHLDGAKAVAAASLLPKLWKYLPKNGTALTFDEANQLFKDGHVAMLVTWPSFVTNSLDAAGSPVKGKWGMTAFPGPGSVWLSLWQLFMPKSAPDKQLAWEWMKAFAGPEHAKENLVKYNIDSVWTATYDDPELKQSHAHFWPAMLAGFSHAKNPPLSGEAQDFLTNTLQDIANGRTDPAAGIRAVNAKWATIPVSPALLQAGKASGFAAE